MEVGVLGHTAWMEEELYSDVGGIARDGGGGIGVLSNTERLIVSIAHFTRS